LSRRHLINSSDLFVIKGVTVRRKELENLNNFSLRIRPELKIANFPTTIMRFFCDSLIQSFLNFYFGEKNMFADYLLGHWSIKKITNFQKYWKNTLQESCTKKNNFAPGAASHTFFWPCKHKYICIVYLCFQ